jgi:hypothetical protein
MEVMMEVLMCMFNKIISKQKVLSHKEKEIEMLMINATMNDKSVSDNSKKKGGRCN